MPALDPGALYPLPEFDDAPHICASLSIPGDIESISNFVGTLLRLANWNNYRRDDAKRGIKIARVWQKIVRDLTFTDCEGNPVALGSFDGDELMTSLCESLRFQNGKLQALCCGAWVDVDGQAGVVTNGGVAQVSTTGALVPGTCEEYDVVLSSDGRAILNHPVAPGDVITITQVSGAWNDGTLAWFTPRGFGYVGGLETTLIPPAAADPLQAVGHMRLLFVYNVTTPTYGDGYGTSIVIPAGAGTQTAWMQCNDSALAGNFGSIKLHISHCAAAVSSVATITYDFTVNNQSWVAQPGYNTSYVAATGWRHTNCDTAGLDFYDQAIIRRQIANATRILSIEVTFDRVYSTFNDGATGSYAAKNFAPGGGGVAIGSDASMATGTAVVKVFNANPQNVVAGDYLTVAVVDGYLHARGNCASFGAGQSTIKKIIITYDGAAPF